MKAAKKALPSIVLPVVALPPEAGAESPEENTHEGRGTHR